MDNVHPEARTQAERNDELERLSHFFNSNKKTIITWKKSEYTATRQLFWLPFKILLYITTGTTFCVITRKTTHLALRNRNLAKNTTWQDQSRRSENGRIHPRQGREGRVRWGTSMKQRAEKWTSARVFSNTAQTLV